MGHTWPTGCMFETPGVYHSVLSTQICSTIHIILSIVIQLQLIKKTMTSKHKEALCSLAFVQIICHKRSPSQWKLNVLRNMITPKPKKTKPYLVLLCLKTSNQKMEWLNPNKNNGSCSLRTLQWQIFCQCTQSVTCKTRHAINTGCLQVWKTWKSQGIL